MQQAEALAPMSSGLGAQLRPPRTVDRPGVSLLLGLSINCAIGNCYRLTTAFIGMQRFADERRWTAAGIDVTQIP